MAKPYPSLSQYQRAVSYGAICLQLGILLVVALLSALDKPIPHQVLVSFVVAPLCIVGVIYALAVFKPLLNRRRQLALFGLIAPLIVSILAYGYVDGGINSASYSLWLVLLGTSGVLGYGAADIAISVGLGYYLLLIGTGIASGQPQTGSWQQALATVIAMAMSYVIAQQSEEIDHNLRLAKNLSGQLEGEQDKTQLMMEAIADVVIGVDQGRQIIVFNAAAEELTGWDRASALGIDYTTILKLHDPNDQEVTAQNDPFGQVFLQNKPLKMDDYYVISPDNTKIVFSISLAPTRDGEGNSNGAIAIFHDISDQKALQRERNEFVSTASHEMRTPVAAVEGYLAMATNPKLAQVDERAKQYIEKAHQSALHLGKLFRDLLSVTKLEDKRLVDERTVFDLGDLMDSVIEELQPNALKKGLQLSSTGSLGVVNTGQVAPKVLRPRAMVNADRDRIQEVITNFVDNAIKYTPQGSINVGLSESEDFVTLSVQDTGIGISPEEQKHLFQKFYRVNNSMTREIGGTGLGLYISRGLVERYGGRIGVESKPGQGSRFYFSLPLQNETALAGERKPDYNGAIARDK